MVLVLARTTFAKRTVLFFYFQFCIFLFIPLEKNNSYEENKNEKSQACILRILCLGLGM